MTTATILGGLGNQLFQIFNLISYSLSNGIEFHFKSQVQQQKDRPFYWDNFLKSLKPFIKPIEIKEKYKEQQFHFSKIPAYENLNKTVSFEGYFQSYKYFQTNEKEIFKMINLYSQRDCLKDKFDQLYKLENCISMHFRIGDYQNKQMYHVILDVNYYIESLKYIFNKTKKKWNILYFYEENDTSMVTKQIDIMRIEFPKITFTPINTSIPDYEQLLLMSLCRHNIIANSTFSWWGAYFNMNESKIVCYPRTWFGPSYANKKTNDMFPDSWCQQKCTYQI
jgi:hypothetical protein|tara:strand:- start:216 stop:1055 length:840 start_codon:yes stop_codon:yes gene_type:complete